MVVVLSLKLAGFCGCLAMQVMEVLLGSLQFVCLLLACAGLMMFETVNSLAVVWVLQQVEIF